MTINIRKQLIDKVLPNQQYGLYFRLVELEDAEFILSLRNDKKLSRYINQTSFKIEDQIAWLKEYKIREKNGKDFYIICLKEDKKTKLGLLRLYDIKDDNCEYGSWVFIQDSGTNAAVLGDLFVKTMAFEILKFKFCRASTMKHNTNVMRYSKSFNPLIVDEDELSLYYEFYYDNFKVQRNKLLRILKVKNEQ